ncbi:hypothetical protein BN1723_010178 [Verticillium longisporum]|uniref:AAA+ ATPase domain-containing protein n=1 Tax=Verticillium longisporum TaxID=100787 RepID=A0A0G4KW03_VERLO|nr:hypothetical protein BN1723_010178 [Verticillium longisporum]
MPVSSVMFAAAACCCPQGDIRSNLPTMPVASMDTQEAMPISSLELAGPSSTSETVAPGSTPHPQLKTDHKSDAIPAQDKKNTIGKQKKDAKKCSKKHKKKTKKRGKRTLVLEDTSSSSDSDDDPSVEDSSTSDDETSSSDDLTSRKARARRDIGDDKARKRFAKRAKKATKKAKGKTKVEASGSDVSAAGSDSDTKPNNGNQDDDDDDGVDDDKVSQELTAGQLQIITAAVSQVLALQSRSTQGSLPAPSGYGNVVPGQAFFNPPVPSGGPSLGKLPPPGRSSANRTTKFPLGTKPLGLGGADDKKKHPLKTESGVPTRLEYKRVDQVWDSTIHNFKLQSTAEGSSDAQYDAFVLQIRRVFDFEGKYKSTTVDVKSKLLRECFQDVIGNIKGVSLVDNTPRLDPNLLFLYLDDLRAYSKELKASEPSGETKRARQKAQKHNKEKRRHLKVLLAYLDKDYAQVKKSLYPMLENGLITFELLWALWKPNTLAYTATYGSEDEPRVFKVEAAEKHTSFVKGDFYYIDGKYFEYDGKQFGYGSFAEEVSDFRGARKITSLNCYPLKYHKNEQKVREHLISRGKKFVQLGGVQYKCHEGMAYYKKKKNTIKINVNGRIMVDPSIHRRCNPNYPVPMVRVEDHDLVSEAESDDEDAESGCGCVSETESDQGEKSRVNDSDSDETVEYVRKVYKDENGQLRIMRVPKELVEEQPTVQELDAVESKPGQMTDATASDAKLEFSDEQYLLASPVVLGFSFGEKMWLEFSVSGVKDIKWNEEAYDSLVLQEKPKAIVKALVETHRYHGAESIDDVIQGKGKGLVAVLHGPPGTGKTLTAEGISELLKCPLYMASAGELGTDSRFLETELQKILDICHAWGAILLLDEADVFLEKRNMHDIHRNALVSIFLRQLEYFQGILFLTTNRVETFDDAFQSRIHVALRYDKLSVKAKRAIFQIFIERARTIDKVGATAFTDEDYDYLTKFDLNGRQIKNTIRTAQALATNKKEALSMLHIKDVLEVQRSFEQDLKGGTGYEDAMRAYQ